jgi:peptide/nickel transport system permease protein
MTSVSAAPDATYRPQWRVVSSNRKVMLGLGLLALFLLAIPGHFVLQELVWRNPGVYDPVFGYDQTVQHPTGPSGAHWLGTDSRGRDVMSILTAAARPTMTVALTAGLAIGVISLLLGSVAAYRRGWADSLVSHVGDAMVLLPPLLAVLVLGVGRPDEVFGSVEVGVTFGVLYALGPATAAVRAAALTVMAKPFIDAARVAGGGGFWLVSRHVLPHLVPQAAVQTMIGVTGAVVAEAFLSYDAAVGEVIGFGQMVYDGITWAELFAGIAPTPWWVMIAGAGAISVVAAAFYLLGIGLREAFDPKTHRSVL